MNSGRSRPRRPGRPAEGGAARPDEQRRRRRTRRRPGPGPSGAPRSPRSAARSAWRPRPARSGRRRPRRRPPASGCTARTQEPGDAGGAAEQRSAGGVPAGRRAADQLRLSEDRDAVDGDHRAGERRSGAGVLDAGRREGERARSDRALDEGERPAPAGPPGAVDLAQRTIARTGRRSARGSGSRRSVASTGPARRRPVTTNIARHVASVGQPAGRRPRPAAVPDRDADHQAGEGLLPPLDRHGVADVDQGRGVPRRRRSRRRAPRGARASSGAHAPAQTARVTDAREQQRQPHGAHPAEAVRHRHPTPAGSSP